MNRAPITWQGIQTLASRSYVCGHCGSPLASEKGWVGVNPGNNSQVAWTYVCHLCFSPTYFGPDGKQTPGSVFGGPVEGIPVESVQRLYDEARNATASASYTAAVLSCRKLLMHIAVAKGADEGKSFVEYVEYLAAKSYVPPDARDWVDHIRAKGNEANHQIVIMGKDDAEDLISFCEMLLKVIYEFPAAVKGKKNVPPPAA